MNERIKELYNQADKFAKENRTQTISGPGNNYFELFHEKFAELIVRECKENFAKVWYEQGVDCRGAELDKFMTRFDQHFGVEE
jgi:hypothetical protein